MSIPLYRSGAFARLPYYLLKIALAAGLALPAFAQPSAPPLTLEAALHLAEARSRTLAAQDAATHAERERAVAAQQLPDPLLRFSVDNLPIEGEGRFKVDSEPMAARSASLSQTFTRWQKRQARADTFERKAASAQTQRTVQHVNLRRDTALAWLDRHYQQRLLDLLHQQRAEARLQVEATDALYRGGNGAPTDLFASRSAQATLDDRIQTVETLLSNAEETLSRWIGEAATRPNAQLPDIWHTRFTPGLLEANPNLHPDIALAHSREAEASAAVAAARQEKRADWTGDIKYSERDDAFGDMVSVGISIPLQWDQANRQGREVAASLATTQQRRAEREETERERLSQTRRQFATWQTNRGRFQRYASDFVPLAQQRTQAALAAYQGSKGSLSAVLEAREAELTTRIDQLALEQETAALWAQLEYLLPPTNNNKAGKR